MNKDGTKSMLLLSAFTGSIFLLTTFYSFFDRLTFLRNSTYASALVVAVTLDRVPRGKGSVNAYVPIVQLVDSEGNPHKVKVDTFSTARVYDVGQRLPVLCNSKGSCIEDNFLNKWETTLICAALSAIFLAPFLVHRTRHRSRVAT